MTVAENSGAAAVAEFLRARREQLAQQWADLTLFRAVHTAGRDVAVNAAHRLVDALTEVARDGRIDDVTAPGLDQVRALLAQLIAARSQAGSAPLQVAAEIAELKRPVIAMVDRELADADRGAALVAATDLMGTVRLVGMEISLSDEGAIVARQRQQLLETATPVLRLWDRVVAVPLIGTLDSARTQIVMETLLEGIVEERATVAILDITGVPLVDTVVAQHLIKTALAVRLMGARCVVSGIRPQIAQTIVQLGIDLGDVTTRATLADALEWALSQVGTSVGRA